MNLVLKWKWNFGTHFSFCGNRSQFSNSKHNSSFILGGCLFFFSGFFKVLHPTWKYKNKSPVKNNNRPYLERFREGSLTQCQPLISRRAYDHFRSFLVQFNAFVVEIPEFQKKKKTLQKQFQKKKNLQKQGRTETKWIWVKEPGIKLWTHWCKVREEMLIWSLPPPLPPGKKWNWNCYKSQWAGLFILQLINNAVYVMKKDN